MMKIVVLMCLLIVMSIPISACQDTGSDALKEDIAKLRQQIEGLKSELDSTDNYCQKQKLLTVIQMIEQKLVYMDSLCHEKEDSTGISEITNSDLTLSVSILTIVIALVQIFIGSLFVILFKNYRNEMDIFRNEVEGAKDKMHDLCDKASNGQEKSARLYDRRYDELIRLFKSHKESNENYVSFMVMYLSDYLGKIDDYSPEDIKQMVDLYYGDSDIVGKAIHYFKQHGSGRHLPYIRKAMEMDRIPLWKPFFEQAIAEIEKREGTTQDS